MAEDKKTAAKKTTVKPAAKTPEHKPESAKKPAAKPAAAKVPELKPDAAKTTAAKPAAAKVPEHKTEAAKTPAAKSVSAKTSEHKAEAAKTPAAKLKANPAKALKVFEAAKDLKMSGKALLAILQELNFNVKTMMSVITDDMIASAKQRLEQGKQDVKREQEQQKKIQEKKEASVKAEANAQMVAPPTPVIVSKVDYPKEFSEPYPEAPKGIKPGVPRPGAPRPGTPYTRTPRPGGSFAGAPRLGALRPIGARPQSVRPPMTEEDSEQRRRRRRRRKKKEKRPVLDQAVVAATVKQTMAAIQRGKARRSYKFKDKEEVQGQEAPEQVVRLPEYSSISDLSHAMGVKPSEVVAKALGLGIMATINQRLDLDTLATIADDFGYVVEEMEEFTPGDPQDQKNAEPMNLKPRPPVVTVMGHVDHGKTSLLDRIRKSSVAEGEFGGITQHIGAYEVKAGKSSITFLDTPGHAAFTAMRARGAQVTDIVILVVAASEGVMPQTQEAIDHAQAAKVPVIVAINKMDLLDADPLRIKQDLSKQNLAPEDWGGKTIYVEVSAKTGANIDKLLEMVLLQAEMMDLKADPDYQPRGVVIESRLDKGKGILATVLVQQGTLQKGQPFVAGNFNGKIRAMYGERGNLVAKAGPSSAAVIQGFNGAPMVGDVFQVMDNESAARELALKRQQLKREQEFRPGKKVTLDGLYDQMLAGEIKELKLIVKGDAGGSVEAIADSVFKMSTDQLKIAVIHKGVGAITESDVLLAEASRAIIIGFHVRPEERARELAEREGVDIRTYNIIYDALEDIKKAQTGMLAPVFKESVQGRVEVRETYKISGVGTIAGCFVLSGSIARNNKVRLLRDNVEVFGGKLASLKRFKDDVREVQNGFECGLGLDGFNDIKKGDIVESYIVEEVKRE
ncbi:translation initiation factor IF-2 [candidate division TA06 bacterium]|uniref:Translation initiation factor IF-2 n=1 Tax=candidate division TA06 bacterium TaxID=2250710 RepID=A0A933I7A6_UNCT6|nr:translation initiation factor IF-2 [candidate division TA06 bacterium]